MDEWESGSSSVLGPLNEKQSRTHECRMQSSTEQVSRDAKYRTVIDDMDEVTCEIEPINRERIAKLIWEHRHILSLDDFDIGYTDPVSHRIDMGDNAHIRQVLKHIPKQWMTKSTECNAMQGVIEPCASPLASNIVLVKKKDGSICCTVDYRRLNSITR